MGCQVLVGVLEMGAEGVEKPYGDLTCIPGLQGHCLSGSEMWRALDNLLLCRTCSQEPRIHTSCFHAEKQFRLKLSF